MRMRIPWMLEVIILEIVDKYSVCESIGGMIEIGSENVYLERIAIEESLILSEAEFYGE